MTSDQWITETGNQWATVQEVFDQFIDRSSYLCGSSLMVDKQLINFYGNCRFRTFIPSKPGKYGLKLRVMADSDTYHCADAQLAKLAASATCDKECRNVGGAAADGKCQRDGQEHHH